MTMSNDALPVSSVIVLDLDDTLYLERDYVRSGLEAVGALLRRDHNVDGFFDCATAEFDAGRRNLIFDTVLPRLGLRPSPSLIGELVAAYRGHEPVLQLQPDAVEFLAGVHPGAALALLTDGFLIAQRNKIRALGLDRLGIHPIVCTDVWGRRYWKPHARGFKHIQAHHGLAGPACIYIADNPSKDFLAPRRLGWRTVHIKRPQRIHVDSIASAGFDADFEIETLAELNPARLEQVLSVRSDRAA